MIGAFFHGFAFTVGAIAAGLTFLLVLGAWDWLSEFIKVVRKATDAPGVNPGESLMGRDEPAIKDIGRARARIR